MRNERSRPVSANLGGFMLIPTLIHQAETLGLLLAPAYLALGVGGGANAVVGENGAGMVSGDSRGGLSGEIDL